MNGNSFLTILPLECQTSRMEYLRFSSSSSSFFFFMATSHSKSLPALVHVDDILFRKPVEIGSLLYFSSQVVYTQGRYVMVRVSAEVVHPESGSHDLTNVFHFTFRIEKEVPEVIPRSYQGTCVYVYVCFTLLHSAFLRRSLSFKRSFSSCLFFFGRGNAVP